MVLKDPIINKLIKLANKKNVKVRLLPFKAYRGRLKGNRIGINSNLNIEDLRYTLAHEIAHLYLHIDKGNTITSPKHEEYEEQANRAAEMLLDLLSIVSSVENNNLDIAI